MAIEQSEARALERKIARKMHDAVVNNDDVAFQVVAFANRHLIVAALEAFASEVASKPSDWVMVPREFIDFLCGAAPYDGTWFGDGHDRWRGTYWWRTTLRQFAASPTPPVSPVEERTPAA